MQNTKVLELINAGRIEELKAALRDEIYADALKKVPGAKNRYSAMKKYFGYIPQVRESLQKPCMIEFEGTTYTSFCNSHSLVLTKEPCGGIELFTDVDRYPQVDRLIHFDGDEETIDLAKVFAEAKAKGYKLKKSELFGEKYQYVMRYKDACYKLGLVGASFAIIDDGKTPSAYYRSNVSPLTLTNELGICIVMPLRGEVKDFTDRIIIDANQ